MKSRNMIRLFTNKLRSFYQYAGDKLI